MLRDFFFYFNVSRGKTRELRVERDCCNRLTQPPLQGSFRKPVSNIPEKGRPLAELTSSETAKEEERNKKEDKEDNKGNKTEGEIYWKTEKEKKRTSKHNKHQK